MTVSCPAGIISKVLFASYGIPGGSCSNGYSEGNCHATTSKEIVEAACVGKESCTILAENSVFTDPW